LIFTTNGRGKKPNSFNIDSTVFPKKYCFIRLHKKFSVKNMIIKVLLRSISLQKNITLLRKLHPYWIFLIMNM